MPRFVIKEKVSAVIHVDADTGEEALEAWLVHGLPATVEGAIQEDVEDRWVEDDKGNVLDVECE